MPEYRLSCYALVRNARGEVLMLQRPAHKRRFAGLWEFPGGKMEVGEGIGEAVCREVEEEAGIHVKIGGLAGAVEMTLPKYHVIMLIFEARAAGGAGEEVTISHEHQDWRWVKFEAVAGMDLTPPVREFLGLYQGRPAQVSGK